MTNGVVYQLTGDRHAVVLVVSLWTLRKHYKGPVVLFVGEERSRLIGDFVDADKRLNIEVRDFEGLPGRNGAYLNKTLVHKLSPFDKTVFIDADTVILGPFDEMFPRDNEIVLTQFAEWKSTGKMMRGRVERLREVAPELVTRAQTTTLPAINTGVFSFAKDTAFMEPWREMTHKKKCFMADELMAQIMFPDYPHRIEDDRFNWSAVHGKAKREEARILHSHGKKHVARQQNLEIWWPAFCETMVQNVAQIRDWCPAGDQRLQEYLTRVPDGLKPW